MTSPAAAVARGRTPVIDAGLLSCYTASLARYLEGTYDDPLTRVARSVRLAVCTGLPNGLVAFSNHGTPLCDLEADHRLVYRGAPEPAALLAGLDREMATGHGALAVTYTGAMAWSRAAPEQSAPHFLLLRARRGGRWRVEDAFRALLPTGHQEPFTGWISTDQLVTAMTPPLPLRPEHRLRKQYAFGFAVPLPPDEHYQWLSRDGVVPGAVVAKPPGWICDLAALRFLGDFWAALDQHPDRVRFLDDMWACARHHTFRYAHLMSSQRLARNERRVVAAAHDAWQDLPMALRFVADCLARGRARPSLIRTTFGQLLRLEDDVAGVLATYGYGTPGGYSDTSGQPTR
jgi:hypothetical protein